MKYPDLGWVISAFVNILLNCQIPFIFLLHLSKSSCNVRITCVVICYFTSKRGDTGYLPQDFCTIGLAFPLLISIVFVFHINVYSNSELSRPPAPPGRSTATHRPPSTLLLMFRSNNSSTSPNMSSV